jgi:hypothetical protein
LQNVIYSPEKIGFSPIAGLDFDGIARLGQAGSPRRREAQLGSISSPVADGGGKYLG